MGNIFSRSSPAKRPLAPAPAPAPLPPSPPPPQYSSVSQVDRKPQQNSDTPDAAQKSDPQRGHPSWTPRQTTILSTLRSRPHVTARAPEELPAIRDEMEEDAAKRPLPVDIKTELVRVKREGYWKGLEEAKGAASGGGGAIECEWVEVNDNTDHVGDPSKPVVLFVHGGGFCFMSTTTHRPLTVAFARMGTRVFAINYRLAPEHPYPAPLADVITTYRYLLDEARISPSRIIIAGDSAGGNLVLAAALYLRESGMEPPAGVVAMSPWADLTGSAPSNLINVLDIGPVIPSGPVDGPKRLNHYAPNKILHRPIVSPLFSFVTGTPLPPTYIVTGDLERAFDEHVGVALKWSEDGYGRKGGVWADVFEGQVHVSLSRIHEFITTAIELARNPNSRTVLEDRFCVVNTDGVGRDVGRAGFQALLSRNYEKATSDEGKKLAREAGWTPTELDAYRELAGASKPRARTQLRGAGGVTRGVSKGGMRIAVGNRPLPKAKL